MILGVETISKRSVRFDRQVKKIGSWMQLVPIGMVPYSQSFTIEIPYFQWPIGAICLVISIHQRDLE